VLGTYLGELHREGGVASVRGGGAPSTWQTEGQLLLRSANRHDVMKIVPLYLELSLCGIKKDGIKKESLIESPLPTFFSNFQLVKSQEAQR